MRPICFLLPSHYPLNWLVPSGIFTNLAERTTVFVVLPHDAPAQAFALETLPVKVVRYQPVQSSRLANRIIAINGQVFMHSVGATFVESQMRVANAFAEMRRIFLGCSPRIGDLMARTGFVRPLIYLDRLTLKHLARKVDPALKTVPNDSVVIQPLLRARECSAELLVLNNRGCTTMAHFGGWDALEYAGYIPDVYDAYSCWSVAQVERFKHHYPERGDKACANGHLLFQTIEECASTIAREDDVQARKMLFADGGLGMHEYDKAVLPQLMQGLRDTPRDQRPEFWIKPYPGRDNKYVFGVEGEEFFIANEESVRKRWPEAQNKPWNVVLMRKMSLVMGGGSTLQLEGVLCGTPALTPTVVGKSISGQPVWDAAWYMKTHQRPLYEHGAVPLVPALTPPCHLIEQAGHRLSEQQRVVRGMLFAPEGRPLDNLLATLLRSAMQ